MQKTPIRTNVLLLVGGGYFALLFMFTVMAIWGEMKIEEAYEVVKGTAYGIDWRLLSDLQGPDTARRYLIHGESYRPPSQ